MALDDVVITKYGATIDGKFDNYDNSLVSAMCNSVPAQLIRKYQFKGIVHSWTSND